MIYKDKRVPSQNMQDEIARIIRRMEEQDEEREECSRIALMNVLLKHGMHDFTINELHKPVFLNPKDQFIYDLKGFEYYEEEYTDEFFRLLEKHDLV